MYLQLITMLDRSDQEPLDEQGNSFLYCYLSRETNNDYLKALGLPVRSTCTPATPYHTSRSLPLSSTLSTSLLRCSLRNPTPFPPLFSLLRRLIVRSFPSGKRPLNYGFFSRIVSSWIITTQQHGVLSRFLNLWLRSFFPFLVLCIKMILTQQEPTLAYDLLQGNLGRRVKERLENALEGASTSETITTQASYCREVLYVLDKCSWTYFKKTLWELLIGTQTSTRWMGEEGMKIEDDLRLCHHVRWRVQL